MANLRRTLLEEPSIPGMDVTELSQRPTLRRGAEPPLAPPQNRAGISQGSPRQTLRPPTPGAAPSIPGMEVQEFGTGRSTGAPTAMPATAPQRAGVGGLRVNEVPMTADQARTFSMPGEAAHGERVNPTPPANGRYGLPANPEMPIAQPVGAPAPVAARPTLRQTAAPMAKDLIKSGMLGVAGYGAARSLADVGKDDAPGTNVETRANVNAIPTGGNAPAPAAQPYNAWTDTEVGRNVGNMLNATAPLTGAVGGLLRAGTAASRVANATGAVAGGMAVGAGQRPEDPAATAPKPRAANPAATYSAGDATMPGQDPNHVTLRGQAGADVDGAPGVSKFTQNGKTLYSNVPGPDNDRLMSNRPGVSVVPGMRQADIDAALTNPDGSRWSAGDNAIMAANLRDGVDAYRGTSRQAGEDATAQQGNLRSLATSPMGTPGRAFAQKQLGQQMTDQTTRRGQDLDYGAKQETARAAGLRAQQDQRNADRTFGAGREDAANALEGAAQTRGFNANENTRKALMQFNPDGSENKQLSAQMFDVAAQIFPGINSADEATRNKVMPDAKEMMGIFAKARSQDKVGWDAMKFWEAKRPALSGMPDARGGTTEQTGALAGLVTFNASSGDTLLKRNDGSTLNLGPLTSRQRELVEKAKTSGWGK